MSFVYYNPNPKRVTAGDCVVRGIATIENISWEEAYDDIVAQGRIEYEMPSANLVLDSYLHMRGYVKRLLPPSCPHCYTVRDFSDDHPYGTYLLGTGSHVVAVVNGDYYDSWNSGNEIPIYYWTK